MVDAAVAAAAGSTPAADADDAAADAAAADAATDSADAAAVETEQLAHAQRWAWAPQGCMIYIQYNLRLVFDRWVMGPHKWKKKGEKNTTLALDMGDIRLPSLKN